MFQHKFYLEDVEKIALMQELDWDKLDGKKIVVTGATGMTASMLIDVLMYRNINLNANIMIYAVSRMKDQIIKRFVDYLDNPLFQAQVQNMHVNAPDVGDIDYMFHAAGYTTPDQFETDPIGTISMNIIGIHKMLRYASTHQTGKVVFFSSVDIYGTNRGDTGRFTEDYCGYIDCMDVNSGFGESKRVGETLCMAYAQQYGLDISVARLCKIYGPSMSLEDSKAIAKYLKNAIMGEDILIKGNREEIYSYCYNADAVVGILMIALKGRSMEAYNIADNREPLNATLLAKKISHLSESRVVEDVSIIKPFETGMSYANNYLMDAGKLEALGWRPKMTMQEGLKRTYEALLEKKKGWGLC